MLRIGKAIDREGRMQVAVSQAGAGPDSGLVPNGSDPYSTLDIRRLYGEDVPGLIPGLVPGFGCSRYGMTDRTSCNRRCRDSQGYRLKKL